MFATASLQPVESASLRRGGLLLCTELSQTFLLCQQLLLRHCHLKVNSIGPWPSRITFESSEAAVMASVDEPTSSRGTVESAAAAADTATAEEKCSAKSDNGIVGDGESSSHYR
jgi:hypothetical protein